MGLNNDANLQCLIKFDTESGSDVSAADSSGNSRSMTLTSTATDGTQWIDGKLGDGALLCTPVAGYTYISNNVAFDVTSFTVCIWLKLNTLAFDRIVARYDGTTIRHFVVFSHVTGNLEFSVRATGDGQNYASTATGVLVANKWQHIAMTCNGTHISGYVDGILETGPTDMTGHIEAAVGRPTYFNNLSGAINSYDDYRFYDRVLTAGEIHHLYRDSYSVSLYANKKKMGV